MRSRCNHHNCFHVFHVPGPHQLWWEIRTPLEQWIRDFPFASNAMTPYRTPYHCKSVRENIVWCDICVAAAAPLTWNGLSHYLLHIFAVYVLHVYRCQHTSQRRLKLWATAGSRLHWIMPSMRRWMNRVIWAAFGNCIFEERSPFRQMQTASGGTHVYHYKWRRNFASAFSFRIFASETHMG